MVTAERPAATPLELVYDGFISYSHAADDLLAPRLQAGLQKFAKPWWKRRAVRIFRDESSLAANPHLWSSITEALESSGWFVLLLSPDAASSEWVGKEIEHWIASKPADRILPVVTDGEFMWVGDVAGSSVPPALHGVFQEEPRWVDLRFAKGDENLDLKNPEFSSAVADIASAVRGIPKDELASEEVRQHRRTVRIAWAAGMTVTVLAVAAVFAGVFAVGQRNDARDSATIAEQEASRANSEADRANALAEQEAVARADAQANAEAAIRSAALARSRELSASAINVLDSNPELAILLTLEAIAQTPEGDDQPAEVINALWQAVQRDRLVGIIDTGHSGNIGAMGLSPDGSRLALANHGTALVQVRSAPDGALVWELRGTDADSFITAEFSPDGENVLVGGSGPSSDGTGGPVGRIVILDANDGTEIRRIDYPECNEALIVGSWSHDGGLFFALPITFSPGAPACLREGAPGGWWLEVLDGETFEPMSLVELPSTGFSQPRFDQTGRLYVLNGGGSDVTIHDPPDYELVRVLEGVRGYGDVSLDGSTLVTFNGFNLDLSAYDTETGAVVDRMTPLPAFPFEIGIQLAGPDGWLVYPSEGEATFVWDIGSGERLFDLHSESTWSAAISPDGRWMYTGHTGGVARVWDLGPAVGFEEAGDLGSFQWVNGNSFFVGPELGAFAGIDFESPEFSRMFFFDLTTGAQVGDPVPLAHPRGALADGRFLSEEFVTGVWVLVDPATGESVPIAQCTEGAVPGVCTETGTDLSVSVSIDGSELLRLEGGTYTFLDPFDLSTIDSYPSAHSFIEVHAFSDTWVVGEIDSTLGDGDLVVEDRASGDELARLKAPATIQVSATDSNIAIWNELALQVLDTTTWESRVLELDVAGVRGLSIDWNRQRFAIGDENGLHVFDLDTGELLAEVPMPSVSDIHWIDEDTVLVGTNGGIWATVGLHPDDLVASAAASVTRGFTDAECSTYRIDPCPTLEEIRSR